MEYALSLLPLLWQSCKQDVIGLSIFLRLCTQGYVELEQCCVQAQQAQGILHETFDTGFRDWSPTVWDWNQGVTESPVPHHMATHMLSIAVCCATASPPIDDLLHQPPSFIDWLSHVYTYGYHTYTYDYHVAIYLCCTSVHMQIDEMQSPSRRNESRATTVGISQEYDSLRLLQWASC